MSNFLSVPVLIATLLALTACGGSANDTASSPNVPSPPQPPEPVPMCDKWQDGDVISFSGPDVYLGAVAFDGPCSLIIAKNTGYDTSYVINASLKNITKSATGDIIEKAYVALSTSQDNVISGVSVEGDNIAFWGSTKDALAENSLNQGREDVFWGRYSSATNTYTINQWGTECPDYPVAMHSVTEQWFLSGSHDVCVESGAVTRWQDYFILSGDLVENSASLTYYTTNFTDVPDYITASEKLGEGFVIATTVLAGSKRGIWIHKLDALGNALWSSQLSTSTIDNVTRIISSEDNIFVVGTTYIQLGATHHGEGDIFLAQVSGQSGDVSNIAQIGTEQNEWVADAKREGNAWWFGIDYTAPNDTQWKTALYYYDDTHLVTRVFEALDDNQHVTGIAVSNSQIALYGDEFSSEHRRSFIRFVDKSF